MRGAVDIGANGGDVDDRGATDGLGGPRHRFGACGMHGVEALVAALEQDADQIDHGVGVAHRRLDRMRVAQIGLHGLDLADPAQAAANGRHSSGPAHRDADAVAAVGQRAHHVAAEKTRAAEHGDKRLKLALDCHVAARLSCAAKYMIGFALYRGLRSLGNRSGITAHRLTRGRPLRTYRPARRPGGGIGRRTSFRY